MNNKNSNVNRESEKIRKIKDVEETPKKKGNNVYIFDSARKRSNYVRIR